MSIIVTSLPDGGEPAAVLRLRDQAERWFDRSITVACLASRTHGLHHEGIMILASTPGWGGDWSALDAMRPSGLHGSCLYIAPGARIVGPLDELFIDSPGVAMRVDANGDPHADVIAWQGDMGATHALLREYRDGLTGPPPESSACVILHHALLTTKRGFWPMRQGLVKREGEPRAVSARPRVILSGLP